MKKLKINNTKISKARAYFILIVALLNLANAVRNDLLRKNYISLTIFLTIVILTTLYVAFQFKDKNNVGEKNPLTKSLGKTSLNIFTIIVIIVVLISMAVYDENFRLGIMTFFRNI